MAVPVGCWPNANAANISRPRAFFFLSSPGRFFVLDGAPHASHHAARCGPVRPGAAPFGPMRPHAPCNPMHRGPGFPAGAPTGQGRRAGQGEERRIEEGEGAKAKAKGEGEGGRRRCPVQMQIQTALRPPSPSKRGTGGAPTVTQGHYGLPSKSDMHRESCIVHRASCIVHRIYRIRDSSARRRGRGAGPGFGLRAAAATASHAGVGVRVAEILVRGRGP
jgi:hypothetical protein